MKNNILIFTSILVGIACSTKQSIEKNVISERINFEFKEIDQNFRDSLGTNSFIKLKDGYSYYELGGPVSGETIILVHGFSVPSYIWDSTYNASIKKGFRVLRFDAFGRGFSDRPDLTYDIDLSYRQLSGLIDSLQLRTPVSLVGLSWGGRVVSYYTALHPEKVSKLILVDPSGFELVERRDTASIKISSDKISKALKERAPLMAKSQLDDFYHPENFGYWPALYLPQMEYKGFVRALLSTSANKRDLSNHMTQIATNGTPVKLIMGKEDKVVKPEEVMPLAKQQIPRIDITLIENAGHLPHMEETLKFNIVFFDFLDEN